MAPSKSDKVAKLIFHAVPFESDKKQASLEIDVFNQCVLLENEIEQEVNRVVRLERIAKAIYFAVTEASKIEAFDVRPFGNALEKLKLDSFRLAGRWNKWIAIPESGVEIGIAWDIESLMRMYFVQRDKKKENFKCSTLFLELPVMPWLIKGILGRIVRAGDEIISLETKAKDSSWNYNYVNHNVVFVYPRAQKGDGHGYYILGKKLIEGDGVLKDVDRGLENIKLAANLGYVHAVKFLHSKTQL